MKKVIFFILIGIATTCVWGCGSSEDNNNDLIDAITEYRLPKHLKAKSEMPLWMAEHIASVEDSQFYGMMSVLQFKWNGKTFYTFYSGYSLPLYEIYDEAGVKKELSNDERNACIQSSKEWTCIYYYSTLKE